MGTTATGQAISGVGVSAEPLREPTRLVLGKREVVVELQRAQHGVRPGLVVGGLARALQAPPGLARARQLLGIAEGTSKSQVFKARAKLRALLRRN